MTDAALGIQLLKNLRDAGDGGLPEEALAIELEQRCGRPLTTVAFADALAHCRNQGWIGTRENEWGLDVWFIRDSGLNRIA
jgi:hypothetical protein